MLRPGSADAEEPTTIQDHFERRIHMRSYSAESGVAVRVEEAATGGYTRIWCLKKLNWTKCARLQTKPSHCCYLAAGHLMWQQVHPGRATGRRGQHVFEIFAMDADNKCKNENVENEASGEDDESTDEDSTESKTQTRTTLATWKPPHVETQSVLQLHLEDHHRRRCEQCRRLDIRGSMNRLRQHQDVRRTKPTVRESLPQRVRCEQLERRPCAHQEGHGDNSPALGTPISTRGENLPSAKVSDEATEALKHFLCDACYRLKQPPARRQVAIAHVEMFNDVVSMDVCELPEVEGTQQQREANVDRSEHCGRSIENILKSKTRHLTRCGRLSRAVGFVGLVRRNVSEISRRTWNLCGPYSCWHMEQAESHARYLRMMGERTMEDLDISWISFSSLKEAQRDAKRKFVAQPEISHSAAELIYKEPGSPHRREISWYHTRQPPTRPCCMGHVVFSAHCVVQSTLVEL